MDRLVRGVGAHIYGAQEFIFLLGTCLVNYGSILCHGMYQHHTEETGKFDDRTDRGQRDEAHDADKITPSKAQTVPLTGRQQQPNKSRWAMNGPQESSQDNEDQLTEKVRGLKVKLNDDVVNFDEVAGLDEVKMALEEFACFFLHLPHLTRKLRHRSTTGILLFGPQGTGKTLLIRSFARKYGLALFDVRASAIMSKFVGESEKFVQALFKEVRQQAPAVLMLDECDGLLCNPAADAMQSHNYRLLQNELKNQWSDLMYSADDVVVVGATNKPHDIDMDGFGRRLSLKLHVGLPNAAACGAMLRRALSPLRHNVDDDDLAVLGLLSHEKRLSGYDIDCLVESQLRKAIRNITVSSHFRDMVWNDTTLVVPCSEDAEGARPGPWTRAAPSPEQVSYVPLGFGDVEAAVRRAQPTVDEAMSQSHGRFASQYGTNG